MGGSEFVEEPTDAQVEAHGGGVALRAEISQGSLKVIIYTFYGRDSFVGRNYLSCFMYCFGFFLVRRNAVDEIQKLNKRAAGRLRDVLHDSGLVAPFLLLMAHAHHRIALRTSTSQLKFISNLCDTLHVSNVCKLCLFIYFEKIVTIAKLKFCFLVVDNVPFCGVFVICSCS
jgi:hypothetical protein